MKHFWVFLVLLTTGCVGLVLPTPGHSVIIAVDQDIPSPALTERIITILQDEGLPKCRAPSTCTTSFWQGRARSIDPKQTLIEIGDFPTYSRNLVGHSAQIKRTTPDRLKISVKGVGVYYHEIPNNMMAQDLAQIIKDGLAK